jgi:DNA-binding response OmpR family regulator
MSRILIIDDYAPGADSLARLLEMYGHEADVATSYASGLAAWSPEQVLIVSDRDLGDGDGVDLIRELRARGARARTVLISGGLTAREAAELEAAGAADRVLVKTLDATRQLVAEVKALGSTP